MHLLGLKCPIGHLELNDFMSVRLYSQAPLGNLERDCDSPLQTNTAITSTDKSRKRIAVVSSQKLNKLNISVDQNLYNILIKFTRIINQFLKHSKPTLFKVLGIVIGYQLAPSLIDSMIKLSKYVNSAL